MFFDCVVIQGPTIRLRGACIDSSAMKRRCTVGVPLTWHNALLIGQLVVTFRGMKVIAHSD